MKRIISILILEVFLCSNLAMGAPIKQNALRLPMKFTDKIEPLDNTTKMSDVEIIKFYKLKEVLNPNKTREEINKRRSLRLLLALAPGNCYIVNVSKEEALEYFDAGLLIGGMDNRRQLDGFVLVCPDMEIANELKEAFVEYGPDLGQIFADLADQKIEANKKLAWERMKGLAQERKKGINVFLPIIGVVPALMSYNHYRNQKYTIEEVETDAKKQLEIMKWLRKVMGMGSIYWFMNLEDVWRGVYETNKDYLEKIGVTFNIDYMNVSGFNKPYLSLPEQAQRNRDAIDPSKLKKPDLSVAGSIREQIEFIKMAKHDPEIKKRGVRVSAWIPAPCTLAAKIYGETQFFTLLGDVKLEEIEGVKGDSTKKFEALMSYTYEVLKEYTEALIEAGADAICLLDPSGPQILKHRYFDNERIIGDTNRILDFINSRGVSSIYHACGWVGSCLDHKVLDKLHARVFSFGLEANHDKETDHTTGLETDAFKKNRIVEFYKRKKEADEPVVIIGISASRNFKDLSAQAVFKDASNVIFDREQGLAEIEEDGGLIPGTSCELLETYPDPVEGLRSMIALQYGFRPANNKIKIAIENITDKKLRRLERIRTQL